MPNVTHKVTADQFYLGHLGLLSLHVQEDAYSLNMTFPGSDVQRCVSSCGGGVGVGFVLQQKLHQLLVTHASSTMQRGLIVLSSIMTHNRNQFIWY